MNLKRHLVAIFLAIISIIAIFEFAFQYYYKVGIASKIREQELLGKCSYTQYKELYYQSDNFIANFCMDTSGYIVESPKSKVPHSDIYVCGGSVTEGSILPFEYKWPTVLSKKLDKSVTNDSRSGRDLDKCISRFSKFLQANTSPQTIIIATNVNTIGGFAIEKGTAMQNLSDLSIKYRFKAFLTKYLPGIANAWGNDFIHNFAHLSKKLKSNNVLVDDSLAHYLSGCCHMMSYVNSTIDRPKFDWRNHDNLVDFGYKLDKSISNLSSILAIHGISKRQIIFLIESSSYNLGKSRFGDPKNRQPIFESYNIGSSYNEKDSRIIFNSYNNIYKQALSKQGYKFLDAGQFMSDPSFFYDAVHLTPQGSNFLGEEVAHLLISTSKEP